MSDSSKERSLLPPEAIFHYELGNEQRRLTKGVGELEWVRSQEIIKRYLPAPPAIIFDVGGGPGAYSCWQIGRAHV